MGARRDERDKRKLRRPFVHGALLAMDWATGAVGVELSGGGVRDHGYGGGD